MVRLFCFVCSKYEKPTPPFSVEISSLETVADLKEAILIKNPNTLQKRFDANQLLLYKVSLPDDDSLRESAGEVIKGESPLRSTGRLSLLFPDHEQFAENSIQIVVKQPCQYW
jgi:hypothetical protein